jgi:nucleoid-associated protein YgaU
MAAFYLAHPVACAVAQMPIAAEPPTIEKVVIDQGGASHIEGGGRPGDLVEIVSGGVALGEATVAQSGRWRIDLKTGLKAGTYQIRADARAGAAGAPTAGDEIRIAIPPELGGRTEVQYDGTTSETERATRQRAETLARDAGQAFDEITQKKQQADPAAEPAADDVAAGDRVEQSDETRRDGALAVVIEWLKRSAKTYREEVVQKLRLAKPETAAADPAPDRLPDAVGDPVTIAPPVDAQQAATSIARERAEAEARRIDLARADTERKAEQAAKARAEAAQREALKRTRAEELARKSAEADRRIAEELERLKKAREEAAEAEARRIDLAEADAERKTDQAAKATAEAAQREALKRKQVEELARKKAEADKRIAEELERLKQAREEADRARARKDAELRSDTLQRKATITLERFYLPGEKRPREETSGGDAGTAVVQDAEAARPLAGRCVKGRVVHRKGRRWYVTGADDTLWDIAERFYGSGLAYPRIYRVNRKRLSSPHVVRPCLALRLPGRR